jgi:hypothetical protein
MKRRSEAGQAIAAVAFGLVALVGVVGLAIDMGYMRYEKRRLQSAADSAAIAGASELQYYPSGDLRITTAAQNDSKANGFEDSVNGVTVTSNNPPVDAPFSSAANASNYVEVRVQQNAPTFFMRIFGINSVSLSASAVAHLGSSPGCIYALDPIGLGIAVNANVNAPNCGVVDNALLSIGGGCINAASIALVQPFGGGCATPLPIVVVQASDPLAYLQAPAVGGGCLPDPNINQPAAAPTVLVPLAPPGTPYCSITVQPTNAAAVQFQPGLYVLTNAPGLLIQGTGSVTGTGVTFYTTNTAQVQFTTTGNINLSAPLNGATGGIPGVLFYQDRLDPGAACIGGAGPLCIPTGSNMSLTGTLYFPLALLRLGANQPSAYTILVAQSIQFQGTFNLGDPTTGNDYSSLVNGSPIKAAVLVQ